MGSKFILIFGLMLVVTGAAGFIGSCLVSKLNALGHTDLVLVDDFSKIEKDQNTHSKQFSHKIERSEFIAWLDKNASQIECVFHIGARSEKLRALPLPKL